MADNCDDRIFKFEVESTAPDAFFEYNDQLKLVPIVIDNGSFQCRVGWATDEKPRLTFKNITARPKAKKLLEADVLVGNDITNFDTARWQLKSPFERNIVTKFDCQEQILDYAFSHLGINTEGSISSPVVITEPVCNPSHCREKMSELLFECYHVPHVAYGIDALFSLYFNQSSILGKTPAELETTDALVISCGYQTIHVLPVLNGRLQATKGRRINMGGSTIDGYMQRVLQLKYPYLQAALTLTRAEELVRKYCHMATDFEAELLKWTDDDYYATNVYKIQLPYNQQAAASLSAEQQKGHREQQVRRLREMNIKRCQRKLIVEQERLEKLIMAREVLQDNEDDIDDEIVERALMEAGVSSVEDLKLAIEKLTATIQTLQRKVGCEDGADLLKSCAEQPDGAEDPLKSEEQLQQRHRNIKRPKLEKKVSQLDPDRVPPEGDKQAMDVWIASLHQQRQDILTSQADRRQKRTEMTKRRTHASQNRMKILTELAQSVKQRKEDTFGMNDDDWNVYKQINTDGGDTDSEDETERLDELESYLRIYDPQFKSPNQQSQLDAAFDIAEYYRLHIALEQIRTPEVMFQPSMLGLEQAGLAETIHFVLGKFSAQEQQRLVENVFVTGSCASIPNFSTRLHKELEEIRPFQSTLKISMASDVILDAWKGARDWALSSDSTNYSVSLADYSEKGKDYLKEHFASNIFIPSMLIADSS